MKWMLTRVLAVFVALTVIDVLWPIDSWAWGLARDVLIAFALLALWDERHWLLYRWLSIRHRSDLNRPLVLNEDGEIAGLYTLPGETVHMAGWQEDGRWMVHVHVHAPNGSIRREGTWPRH